MEKIIFYNERIANEILKNEGFFYEFDARYIGFVDEIGMTAYLDKRYLKDVKHIVDAITYIKQTNKKLNTFRIVNNELHSFRIKYFENLEDLKDYIKFVKVDENLGYYDRLTKEYGFFKELKQTIEKPQLVEFFLDDYNCKSNIYAKCSYDATNDLIDFREFLDTLIHKNPQLIINDYSTDIYINNNEYYSTTIIKTLIHNKKVKFITSTESLKILVNFLLDESKSILKTSNKFITFKVNREQYREFNIKTFRAKNREFALPASLKSYKIKKITDKKLLAKLKN